MKQVLYIIPVMFYYFIESIISAVPIHFLWKLFFSVKFNFGLQYVHWVIIIWMVKVIFFDVFKFAAFFDKNNEEQKDKKEN